ncbi:MAG: glycosyltransferase family 4 protein, partial [Anaerolineales bacterium]|nr:glycosyltransferase family 4 protein [Anaerolineales bacterium]
MPSLSEGLPVVGVQALAKGLAIVASAIGGFQDLVVHNENGFLIGINLRQEFGAALRELISDPQKLIQCRNASLEKSAQFDIDEISRKYEDVFRKLTAEKKAERVGRLL